MALLIENCRLGGKEEGSVVVDQGRITQVSLKIDQAVPVGTRRIDGHGGTLLPGFVDTHCHPFSLGRLKRTLDLRGTSNITSIRLRLFAAAQKAAPGDWIIGRGWDHESLSEKRLPAKEDIDDITTENPVVLTRVCGHISLLNSLAIRALGLGEATGPEYDRTPQGELTGVVREGAQEAVLSKVPRSTVQTCLSDLVSIEFEAAKFGLTCLHCIVSEESYVEELEALTILAGSRREPSPRYFIYIPFVAIPHVASHGIREKLSGDTVKIAGVKLYTDGSLGASTAALREPYSDDRRNSGILRYGDAELQDAVEKADSQGYQVIVHAIGDRAVEQALEALSRVSGGGNPRRHRIEHASLFPRDLRSRAKKYGIRVTVQPSFITSDSWASTRLGEERLRDLYPLRSILEEEIVASGSSDAPVETLNPIIGMWASMVRRGFEDGESLTLQQATGLYTANACLNGPRGHVPQIREGEAADLTLLDSDINGMHPAMLRKVGVAASVVDGEVVYSFEGSA
jgi:hypothetical protein